MDEMKLKLSTKFMRGIAAKLISRAIYKKTGYKINLHLNELDIQVVDGEAYISTNVEARINNQEFIKIMKSIGMED